ncbi:helix-turn-helix domain-containing protein [Nocardioides stalactiti]|uniref:helix-turn-helix domain-containing protein n=1 Tax=Nocardioides stalactiti TaxID=2755356 RepID=UPI0015FEEDE9|nr:helix-turn-helix transcriptional regulator [Nocardioides stalactiti]
MEADDEWTERLLVALGHEIKAMRVKRGLSRDEVAELARITARQVGKIERGERGQFSEVWNVAQALDVALSWLVSEAEVAEDGRTGDATVIHTPDGQTYLMPPEARVRWGFTRSASARGFQPTPEHAADHDLAADDQDVDPYDEAEETERST